MSPLAPAKRVWFVVVLFAVGMAWVEAASVYYLRVMVDRVVPYQPNPLPVAGTLGLVEMVREAATLVMLLTVGMLAGRTWPTRLGYTAIAFGVWDILYYVFLVVMTGWPTSVLDWDILFLLPLPWWGPVIAPVSIALLMIALGSFVTQSSDYARSTSFTWVSWNVSGLGILLSLYVFMADAIHAMPLGVDATRQLLPTEFNWSLFCLALGLMAAPALEIGWRWHSRQGLSRESLPADGP
jgi:hypothetical protein